MADDRTVQPGQSQALPNSAGRVQGLVPVSKIILLWSGASLLLHWDVANDPVDTSSLFQYKLEHVSLN